MKIEYNGEIVIIEKSTQLSTFLGLKEFKGRYVVFLNNEKLLYQEVEEYIIKSNDTIRIFIPLSGG